MPGSPGCERRPPGEHFRVDYLDVLANVERQFWGRRRRRRYCRRGEEFDDDAVATHDTRRTLRTVNQAA